MDGGEGRQDRVVGGVHPNNLLKDRGVRFEQHEHLPRHANMEPIVPNGSLWEPAHLVDKLCEHVSTTQGLPGTARWMLGQDHQCFPVAWISHSYLQDKIKGTIAQIVG